MNAQSKSAPQHQVSVQLWVPSHLRDEFQNAVRRQERSMAQAIRHHMQETVRAAQAEDDAAEPEPAEAA